MKKRFIVKRKFGKSTKVLQARKRLNQLLARRMPFEKWFTAKDVKKLNVKPSKDTLVGYGKFARVFRATVRFKDGSKKRVAVKIFFPHKKLTTEQAMKYREVIRALAKAEIPIPKTEMLEWENPLSKKKEWVQVSQLFGKATERTKLWRMPLLIFLDPKIAEEAVTIYARCIDAGYFPFEDAVELIYGKKPLLMDIDNLVRQHGQSEKALIDETVRGLDFMYYMIPSKEFNFFIENMLKQLKNKRLSRKLRKAFREREEERRKEGF